MAPDVSPTVELVSCGSIKCDRELLWEKWEVGIAIPQKLRIWNVGTATQRILLSAPPAPFSIDPRDLSVHLASGMTKTVGVVLQLPEKANLPELAKQQTHGTLEFCSSSGNFAVSLRVLFRKPEVRISSLLNFGRVPVGEVSVQRIELHNDGPLDVRAKWQTCAPFSVIPDVVEVPAGRSVACKVECLPAIPSVFRGEVIAIVQHCREAAPSSPSGATELNEIAVARCSSKKAEDECETTPSSMALPRPQPDMTLVEQSCVACGVASLPFLRLGKGPSPRSLNFGSVPHGKTVSKRLTFENAGESACSFKARRAR